ncbi:hypothetical protein Tco_1407475 [Tanacetum coccineum]
MVLGPENDRASCGELDAQPSPPDEGVMTFLRKKVKTGAVVGKRVLLQRVTDDLIAFSGETAPPSTWSRNACARLDGHRVDFISGKNLCPKVQDLTPLSLEDSRARGYGKVSEVAESPRLADKIKISLSKKRRLVAELEALGEREDVAKPFEHMKEIVARDAVTLEELETLLACALVGVSLKAGFVADMEEKA